MKSIAHGAAEVEKLLPTSHRNDCAVCKVPARRAVRLKRPSRRAYLITAAIASTAAAES